MLCIIVSVTSSTDTMVCEDEFAEMCLRGSLPDFDSVSLNCTFLMFFHFVIFFPDMTLLKRTFTVIFSFAVW